MAETLPNIPFKNPLVDDSGLLSPSWAGFFRQLWRRAGGAVALSNTELQALISGTVTTNVTILQTQMATAQSQITVLQGQTNDLNQGRAL